MHSVRTVGARYVRQVLADDRAFFNDVEHLALLPLPDDLVTSGIVHNSSRAAGAGNNGKAVNGRLTQGLTPAGQQPGGKNGPASGHRAGFRTYAATLLIWSSVRSSRMPRRSVVFSRECWACEALATMPLNVLRSIAHSLLAVRDTTVAARGELYNSASSPKDMLGVPSPKSATFLPPTKMSKPPDSIT